MAYCSDLPFAIICPSSYVNIETMSIISSDKKINKNYFWVLNQLNDQLKVKRKTLKAKEELLKYKELNELA